MTDLIFTPTRVETVLVSSHKTYYVNDEQRIGFQKGVKWLIEQQRIDIEDVTEALEHAKEALQKAENTIHRLYTYADMPPEDKSGWLKELRQALETINKLI